MKKSICLLKYAALILSSSRLKLVSTQYTTPDDNNCLSLQGSVTCPAFSSFFVGLNQSQYTFLQNVTNVSSFDNALRNYVSSPDLYLSSLGCTNKADTTTTIPYARYSLTYMCAILIQDTTVSLPCNYYYNKNPPPLCQSTCFNYTQSVELITDNTDMCPNQVEQADQLVNLNSSCIYWSGLNGTTSCINGLANEPNNCGFDTTSNACAYCELNSDTCCSSLSCHKLSAGGIAGVVIGILIFLAAVAAAVYWFCFKRNKNTSKRGYNGFMMTDKNTNSHLDDSSSALGYYDSQKQQVPSRLPSMIDTTPATTITPTIATTATTTPLEEFYEVKHPYPPQMGDELGLHVGDIVCVAMNFDDGWALGFNVTTGLKGVFPLVCVAPAPEELLEQLLQTEQPTNKILVEDDTQLQQIRDSIQRSISVSSKRSINTLPVSELTYHNSIPRRTASIMRHNNTYDEIESPTSPTLHTPLVDSIIQSNTYHSSFSSAMLSHPEPALFQPVETIEMQRKKRIS